MNISLNTNLSFNDDAMKIDQSMGKNADSKFVHSSPKSLGLKRKFIDNRPFEVANSPIQIIAQSPNSNPYRITSHYKFSEKKNGIRRSISGVNIIENVNSSATSSKNNVEERKKLNNNRLIHNNNQISKSLIQDLNEAIDDVESSDEEISRMMNYGDTTELIRGLNEAIDDEDESNSSEKIARSLAEAIEDESISDIESNSSAKIARGISEAIDDEFIDYRDVSKKASIYPLIKYIRTISIKISFRLPKIKIIFLIVT